MSQLVTGEAVALDLQPAALPSRVLAGLVDLSLQLLLVVLLAALALATSVDLSDAAGAALSILTLVLVLIGYPVLFETLLRGRTPGKAAMGLRVVRDDGGPVGFRQALVRGLTGGAVERPGITLFVGGVVSSLANPQGKRLGDLLAGTVVVRERVAVRGGAVAQMPPQLAGWAAGLDLSALPDDLALSVRSFLARAGAMTPAARDDLGRRLTDAVVAAVGPPPAGTPGVAVLHAVLAERRRREEERLAGLRAGAARSGTAESTTSPRNDGGPRSAAVTASGADGAPAAAEAPGSGRRTASRRPHSPEPPSGGFAPPA